LVLQESCKSNSEISQLQWATISVAKMLINTSIPRRCQAFLWLNGHRICFDGRF
jgi:hypothetical protein